MSYLIRDASGQVHTDKSNTIKKVIQYEKRLNEDDHNHTVNSGTAPWFCIKDGSFPFYKNFTTAKNDDNEDIVDGVDTEPYAHRRMFTCTIESIYKDYWIHSDTSWSQEFVVPYFVKKDLYKGNKAIIAEKDLADADANLIGNKLTWRISDTNLSYLNIGGPYPNAGSQDPTCSAYNYKSEYKSNTTHGFVAWKYPYGNMFTTTNYFNITYNPLATLKTDKITLHEWSDSVDPPYPPGYFTLDVTQFPKKYNKIDITIDGLCIFPQYNNIDDYSEPILDDSFVVNDWNYNLSAEKTDHCFSVLYQYGVSNKWEVGEKYVIKNNDDEMYYAADDGWVTDITEASTYTLEAAENTIETTLSSYDNLTTATSRHGTHPGIDYLGNTFTGNLSYNTTENRLINVNSTYNTVHYPINFNNVRNHEITDKRVWDNMYVYAVNENNSNIYYWEVIWAGSHQVLTGYALESDIASCSSCVNFSYSAVINDASTGTHETDKVANITLPKYTDYITATKKFLKDIPEFNYNDWKDKMCVYTYYDPTTITGLLYQGGTNGTASITPYNSVYTCHLAYNPIINRYINKWPTTALSLTSSPCFTLSNVVMNHTINLGERTDNGYKINGEEHQYIHISYPATTLVNPDNNHNKGILQQVNMYYKFNN